jgi:hypothetical protein
MGDDVDGHVLCRRVLQPDDINPGFENKRFSGDDGEGDPYGPIPNTLDLKTKDFPVTMAKGKHPFPFRTRQLSPSAPMVLPS